MKAICVISSKRHLVQVVKEREKGHRKQEFMENKQHLIRQEYEEQKEQISKLLESIKSEISNRLARTDRAPMSLELVSLPQEILATPFIIPLLLRHTKA